MKTAVGCKKAVGFLTALVVSAGILFGMTKDIPASETNTVTTPGISTEFSAEDFVYEADANHSGVKIIGLSESGKEKARYARDHFSENPILRIPDTDSDGNSVTSIGSAILDRQYFNHNGQEDTYDKFKFHTVSLPASLKVIDTHAFRGCHISVVQFPDGLEKIGSYAFQANQLTELNLPESLLEIGEYAFRWNRLKNVTIPSKIKQVSSFSFCLNEISSLSLPEGLEKIGVRAFSSNLLTQLTLPDTVTQIETGAFENNQIDDLKLPMGELEIHADAFVNNKLTELSLPEGLKKLDMRAFKNNQIQSVHIPALLSSIGEEAFANNGLKTLTFDEQSKLTMIHWAAFKDNALENLQLPNKLTMIGASAFANNQLTEVQFPYYRDWVLGGEPNCYIGKESFKNNKLKAVKFDTIEVIYENAFENNEIMTVEIGNQKKPCSIKASAFKNNRIRSVKLPSWIRSEIADTAFEDNANWINHDTKVAVFLRNHPIYNSKEGYYLNSLKISESLPGEHKPNSANRIDSAGIRFNPVVIEFRLQEQDGSTNYTPVFTLDYSRTILETTKGSAPSDSTVDFKIGDTICFTIDEKIKEYYPVNRIHYGGKEHVFNYNEPIEFPLLSSDSNMITVSEDGADVVKYIITLSYEGELPKDFKKKEEKKDEKKDNKDNNDNNDNNNSSSITLDPVKQNESNPVIPTFTVDEIPSPRDETSPETIYVVDEDGAPKVYTKTTDEDGNPVYVDEDGVPLAVEETLKEMPKTGDSSSYAYLTGLFLIVMTGAIVWKRKQSV